MAVVDPAAASFLRDVFARRGAMTAEAARLSLEQQGYDTAQTFEAIKHGAEQGWWFLADNSLMPVLDGKVAPNLPQQGSVSEDVHDLLQQTVIDRGAVYREGVVASMVDAGMTPESAREALRKAVKGGKVRVQGDVIVAAEQSYAPAHGEVQDADERLTASQRKRLPTSAFAWPEKRKFPVHDASHARNAMGRLTTAYRAGYVTASEYERIRRNILRSYKQFGIAARAPSALAGPAPEPAVLGRAAEEETKEKDMAKLTPAQLRAVRMRNLQKAWSATGAKGGREEVAEPGRKRGRAKAKAKKPRGRSRSREDWGVMEPKAPKKPAGPAAPKAAKTPEQRRREAQGALQAWRTSVPVGATPPAGPAAPAKPPRAPRAAGPAAPKAPAGKKKAKPRVPPGRYMSPTTGAIIQIQRVYPKENPEMGVYDAVGAGGGLLVGLVLSDMLDRGLATRAPANATEPLYGVDAANALRTRADAVRVGAQLAGAVVFGAGAYFTRNVSTVASYTMGGLTAGFLVRFLLQVVNDFAMPALFKAQSPAEKSFSNRWYADKQDWMQQGATPALPPAPATPATAPPTGGQAGWPGMVGAPMLLPPGAFMPEQPRNIDYGPAATGTMACGADCGPMAPVGCPTCGGGCGPSGCNNLDSPSAGLQPPAREPTFPDVNGNGNGAPNGNGNGVPNGNGNGREAPNGDGGTFIPGIGLIVRKPPMGFSVIEPRTPPEGVVAQPQGQDGGNVIDLDLSRRLQPTGTSYADLIALRNRQQQVK